jgi:hypothetical protein
MLTNEVIELLNKLLERGSVELRGDSRVEPYPIWRLTHTDTTHGVGTPDYHEIVTYHDGRDLVEVLRAAVSDICCKVQDR